MNKLPIGWEKITLGEALQIQKGKKPAGLGHKGHGRVVPYINISAFETNRVKEYAPEQDAPRCKSSDTLLVWDGARAGFSGRGVSGFIGSTLARLTSDLLEPSYLYHFIQSNYKHLNTNTKGVGIPHIDPVVLMEIELLLPPLPEQIRIVEKLEELLTNLDAGVAELKAAQKKLVQYRQSLLKAAVKGHLTADWRAQYQPTETGTELLARIVKERRAHWEDKQLETFSSQGKAPTQNWQYKYPEPITPNAQNLPKLPEGWVWSTLSQIGWLNRGRSKHRPRNAPHLYGNTYPFVQTGDIRHADTYLSKVESFYSEAGLAQSRLWPTGTMCITVSANIGETAILSMEACFPDSVVGFLSASKDVSVRYVEYFMRSAQQKLEEEAPATAQKNINLEILEKIVIPLPPLMEQRQIVKMLDEAMGAAKENDSAIELALKQSTAQRQNILRSAFAGELVSQDPNDEPASALLERTRRARSEQAKQSKPRRTKQKEINTVTHKLIDVLTDANDWLTTQEAFCRCGVTDGASTERIEELYRELRQLDKINLLAVESVRDEHGRKLHDKLKLLKR